MRPVAFWRIQRPPQRAGIMQSFPRPRSGVGVPLMLRLTPHAVFKFSARRSSAARRFFDRRRIRKAFLTPRLPVARFLLTRPAGGNLDRGIGTLLIPHSRSAAIAQRLAGSVQSLARASAMVPRTPRRCRSRSSSVPRRDRRTDRVRSRLVVGARRGGAVERPADAGNVTGDL